MEYRNKVLWRSIDGVGVFLFLTCSEPPLKASENNVLPFIVLCVVSNSVPPTLTIIYAESGLNDNLDTIGLP